MPSEQYRRHIDGLSERSWTADGTVEERRERYRALLASRALPANVRAEPADGAPAESYWVSLPSEPADEVIIWFHGGGYVAGSAKDHIPFAAALSDACQVSVLLPQYRLAPESPHPAAVTDAVDTYRWLLDTGMHPDQIAFGGDSSGGGLALAALVQLRDAGIVMPSAAVLLSPWVDLTCTSASWESELANDVVGAGAVSRALAELYAGGAALTDPLVSPINADLRGLPPMLVLAGEHDVLRHDAEALEHVARRDGVDLFIQVWPHLHHSWPVFAPDSAETTTAFQIAADFLTQALALF